MNKDAVEEAKDRNQLLDLVKKVMSYPVLLNGTPVFQQYGVMPIPAAFVINRDGIVVNRHIGFGPGMEKGYEEEIKALLEDTVAARQPE